MGFLGIIGVLVLGLFLGFKFAHSYYCVDELLEISTIQSDLLCGKITAEEALKQIKKLHE